MRGLGSRIWNRVYGLVYGSVEGVLVLERDAWGRARNLLSLSNLAVAILLPVPEPAGLQRLGTWACRLESGAVMKWQRAAISHAPAKCRHACQSGFISHNELINWF